MGVIGIRPLVERGAEKTQAEFTLSLCNSVARLISGSVRNRFGEPLECLVFDEPIGGAAAAARCNDLFERSGVCASITVTPSWCHITESMDMNSRIPQALWGVNGTDVPGAVTLSAAISAYAQKGIPLFAIYGSEIHDLGDSNVPQDAAEQIICFAYAANAVSQMKGRSILSVGSVSMGIASSALEAGFFEDYLGMRCEYSDMTEVLRRIESNIFDRSEFDKAFAWVRSNCVEGSNDCTASREEKDAAWAFCVKMALIMRDMMSGNDTLADMGYSEEAFGRNAIAAAFEGAREWTDFKPNHRFMESILNSSFDWNGRRPPYIVATENDVLNAVSMLFGTLLTNTSQVFADVRAYWSKESIERVTGEKAPDEAENGLIHITNCSMAFDAAGRQKAGGQPAIKPFWLVDDDEAAACLAATRFYPCSANVGCGGFSGRFHMAAGLPLTMVRLNLVKGQGPVLQFVEGTSVNLPDDQYSIIDKRTDMECPSAWFAPRLTGKGAFKDVYGIMAAWGSNHASLCCGHIGGQLITLCSMLRIPVSMHNAQGLPFRPAVWHSFGTECNEDADFRACSVYGPLYK